MIREEQESPDRVPIEELLAEEASSSSGQGSSGEDSSGQDPEWFLELHEALQSGDSSAAIQELLERLEQEPALKRSFESYRAGVALLERLGKKEAELDGGSVLRDRIVASVRHETAMPMPEAAGPRSFLQRNFIRRKGAGLALLASGTLAAAATVLFFLLLEDRGLPVEVFDRVAVQESRETAEPANEGKPATDEEEESLDGMLAGKGGLSKDGKKKAPLAPSEPAAGAERSDSNDFVMGRGLKGLANGEHESRGAGKSRTSALPHPRTPAEGDGRPDSERAAGLKARSKAAEQKSKKKIQAPRLGDRDLKDSVKAVTETVSVYHLQLGRDLDPGIQQQLRALSVAQLDLDPSALHVGSQTLLGWLEEAKQVDLGGGQLPGRQAAPSRTGELDKSGKAGRRYRGRASNRPTKPLAGPESSAKPEPEKNGLAGRASKRSGRLREKAKTDRDKQADEESVLAVRKEAPRDLARVQRPSSGPGSYLDRLRAKQPVLLRVQGPKQRLRDLLVRLHRQGLSSGTRGWQRIDLPKSKWRQLGKAFGKRAEQQEQLRRKPGGGDELVEVYLLIERVAK